MLLKFIVTVFFAKLAFGPEIREMLDPRAAVFFPQNGNYVVTVLNVVEAENSAVNPGGANDLPLFAKIDGGDGRGKFGRGFGLDLGETKDVAVQHDQVDLARNRYAEPVSADRRFKICQNQPATPPFEKSRGRCLAEPPETA